MVKLKTEYVNKAGKKVELKTPQLRIGNNLGEEESVTVKFLKGLYENTFEVDREGKKVLCKSYAFLADYKGQDVYINITELTCKKLCEAANVDGYENLYGAIKDTDITFTRYINNGKTNITVELMGEQKQTNEIKLTKEQVLQIFVKEKKQADDLIEFEGKQQTFKAILGEAVVSVLR